MAALVVIFLSVSGTAVGATGGRFILGKTNYEGVSSALRNSGSGPALSLRVAANTTPPLAVNSRAKVANFNADSLDGLDSTQLQRRIIAACGPGSAMTGVGAAGGVTCAPFPEPKRIVATLTGTSAALRYAMGDFTLVFSCFRGPDYLQMRYQVVTANGAEGNGVESSGHVNELYMHTFDRVFTLTAGISGRGDITATNIDGSADYRSGGTMMLTVAGKLVAVTFHAITRPATSRCSLWSSII